MPDQFVKHTDEIVAQTSVARPVGGWQSGSPILDRRPNHTAGRSIGVSAALAGLAALATTVSAQCFLVSGLNSGNIGFFGANWSNAQEFVPTASGGLTGPEGIYLLDNGEFLVAGLNSGALHRYSVSGASLGTLASVSSPIDVVRAGNFYMSSSFSSGIVQRVPITGGSPTTFIASGAGGLTAPHGMTIGPSGDLFVVSNAGSNAGRVLRFSATTGAFISVFATNIAYPTELTFGPDGNLYVASSAAGFFGSVKRFNGTTGAFIDDFVALGSGGLVDTHGLVFTPDGSLAVAGGQAVRFYHATTGAYLRQIALNVVNRATYLAQQKPLPVQSASVCPGESATFSVTAVGPGPFTYRWQRNGVPLDSTAYPTATSATLVLPSVIGADAGAYACIVANVCGPIASNPAMLTVQICCRADFDQDGFLSFEDFDAFNAALTAGQAIADFDGDGFLTFEDFDAFVGAFEAGC